MVRPVQYWVLLLRQLLLSRFSEKKSGMFFFPVDLCAGKCYWPILVPPKVHLVMSLPRHGKTRHYFGKTLIHGRKLMVINIYVDMPWCSVVRASLAPVV